MYNVFDPQEPLKGKELKEFYVEREGPREDIKNAILDSKEPTKFLFAGHRGSGKSTELNKLTQEIKEDVFVVNFSIKDNLNLFDLDVSDILLTIGAEIYKNVTEYVNLDEKLVKDLYDWTTNITKIKADDVVKEKGFGVGLKAVFINLGAKMRAQATTREEVRIEIKPRLSDLIEKINSIIFNAEEKLNKKILVIIDDLDKLDLKTAEDLYYGYGSVLIQPECKIIYTIPQALLFTTKIMQITTTYFGEPYILPNIKIKEKNGELNKSECEVMKNIVLKRIEGNLIEDYALELAIKSSGGLVRHFIRIIRRASNLASTKGKVKIEKEVIEDVVAEIRNEYKRILEKDHYEILEEVHKTKEKVDGENFRELLHAIAILEYSNRENWFDVHQIVLPLLR